MPKSVGAWILVMGEFGWSFQERKLDTQKSQKLSHSTIAVKALEQQRGMMMGVWYLILLLCPRVFYYDYKAKRQQRKRDKENLWIPNSGKAVMMVWRSSWTPTNPTPTTLPRPMIGPWTFRRIVDRNGGLEPSCSCTHSLHLASLLLLFSASLSFLLPLWCTSHSFTCQLLPTITTRRLCDGTALLILL